MATVPDCNALDVDRAVAAALLLRCLRDRGLEVAPHLVDRDGEDTLAVAQQVDDGLG